MRLLRSLGPLALAALPCACDNSHAQDQTTTVMWSQSELEAMSARIQAQIEDIRDTRFKQPVAVKVADKQTLLAYMKERTELTEPPEKLAADETIAKLLGVIEPQVDLLATQFKLIEDQVGGFYDPASKTFYLMDTMPKAVAGPILSHELTHALDDQLYDLDSAITKLASVTDASFAYASVVEGSGMTGMGRWQLEHGADFDISEFQEMMDAQQASMSEAPEWLWKPLLGVYLTGQMFLARTTSLAGGLGSNADVDTAFRTWPRSTEQVLHPEKYWDDAQRDEPRAVTFEAGDLPAGWEERRRDTLGELCMAIVTTPPSARTEVDWSNLFAVLGIRFTHEVAAGWGGDRLLLLGREDADWLRWVTVWDSERDAGEFYGGMQAVLPGMRSAATALTPEGGKSGAELEYGEAPGEVVLTIWCDVSKGERRRIARAVGHTIEPAPSAGR